MSKTLVIAEKPSVANDLQRALVKNGNFGGRFEKKKDFFENDRYVISSAIGHLVELTMPKAKWNFESLPLLPDEFGIQPIENTESRLKLLIKLMKRKDVDEIINACDAGREGELIFYYVRQISKVKKPVRRLWMQSMTQNAIIEAFDDLRTEEEMRPLANAALCRSESDWLVGINGTRAMTAFRSRNGGFRRTPVGRVQTPTLTLLVEREKKIMAFEPRTYFEVFGDFGVRAGEYRGRWFDTAFKKDPNDPHRRAERIWEKEKAEAIVARCEGKPGRIEETKKPSRQAPPLLYDLTTLQREGSTRFGFSARNTLGIAQALYERHKVCTYPRTDSRYLPEDYLQTVRGVFESLSGGASAGFPGDLCAHAAKALDSDWIKMNKRVFDDKKVSDHFAIIPTGQIPKNLKEQEWKLFDMIVRRFISVFYPAAEFEVTRRITHIGEDRFRTDGKILVVPGWLAVYGKTAQSGSGPDSLVPVDQGEDAETKALELKESQTKPPPRYTEATLLSGMETAGKLVDDEELRSAMSEKGLGTPATRAAIIEGLIYDKYVTRDQKELIPTQQGIRLIDTLNEMHVTALCSPEMTGEWEHKLKLMEAGQLDRDSFMKAIREMTSEVVAKAREHAKIAKERVYPDLDVACPQCGTRPLKQDDRSYRCETPDCGFSLWKNVASRELQPAEAVELLTNKVVGPLEGFRSRFGQTFGATLELKPDFKIGFVTQTQEEKEAEQAAIREENYICHYPPSGDKNGRIYRTPAAYVLDLAVQGDDDFRKVRLKPEYCKYELPVEQVKKFFTEGRTDVIEKFISKKGRPFKARLVMDPEGRRFVNFEFVRAPAKKKAGAAKKKAGAKKKKAAKKKAK